MEQAEANGLNMSVGARDKSERAVKTRRTRSDKNKKKEKESKTTLERSYMNQERKGVSEGREGWLV